MGNPTIPMASEKAEHMFSERALTDRERDAARSVLAGLTAETAAGVMGIGVSTVAEFRRRAYRKLGVSSAHELVKTLGEKSDAPVHDWRKTLLSRGLSETQAEVLARVAAGCGTEEIARSLHVAPGTVRSARANGYRLLGVHSQGELASLLESEERGRTLASRRRWASGVAAACMACVMLLSIALAVGQASCAKERRHEENPALDEHGVYRAELVPFTAVTVDEVELFGVNESGQRFGRYEFVAAFMGGMADLYAAVLQDGSGMLGYVKADAPEGSGPLYEKEGKTVVAEGPVLRTDQINDPHKPDPETTAFTAYSTDGVELFGVNESGQRFGSRDFANLYLGGRLDLEVATGRNGISGYLLVTDQQHARSGDELAVYASDGTTQVDVFEAS